MGAIVVGLAFVLLYIGAKEDRFGALRAAVALPLLLLVGLGGLMLLITAMVSVLGALDLTDSRRAFGLPDGSVQALIALSLVLIFVIASLYLYSSLPTDAAAVDADLVQSKREFGQQLLTTVGTLAVAVAGFYFGTKSVEAASAAVASEATTIRIIWPSSPISLDRAQSTELSPIIVETLPAGGHVVGSIAEGDPDGFLDRLSSGEFRYRRGPSAEERVVLAFELPNGTGRQELEVSGPAALGSADEDVPPPAAGPADEDVPKPPADG